jgi:formate hydrogenlyase subunit 6/NADH:ubiquinone oxidoreductase subunit I
MAYFERNWLGIKTVLIGMWITLKHLFARNVTVQYPNVHPSEKASADKMPDNARNRIFMEYDMCNGCGGCVRACPVECISLETVKSVPTDDVPPLKDGGKRGLWVLNYEIDFAKCCFCGLCVPACPTGAVRMTTEFEYSTYDKNDLLYRFSDISDEFAEEKKKLYAKFAAEKKKKDAEAKKAKAAAAAKEKAAEKPAAKPKAE